MRRIIYTNTNGDLSVVIPAPKEVIEKILGPLSHAQYEAHVITQSIPAGIKYRPVDDKDIPESREFRNAWCDVTAESTIDISCEKARDSKLEALRSKRDKLLKEEDIVFMRKAELEQDLETTKDRRENLRNITGPLKSLNVSGKYNDKVLLQKIIDLSSDDFISILGVVSQRKKSLKK